MLAVPLAEGVQHFRDGVTKNIIKIMSKMGISTMRSYQGAQIFEALGLGEEVIDRFFTGTTSRLGGMNLEEIEAETRARHAAAFDPIKAEEPLDAGGDYKWRQDGEYQLFTPETIYPLQHACRQGA